MTAPGIKQKTHIQQVDYIRAIASLMVALFHLGGKALPVLKYGWLGVYMFFLLSGFIICWAIPQNYTWRLSGKFILKRVTRIEPPYIISIILAIIINFFWIDHYQPNWLNAACHLAYLNSFLGQPYLSPVYWTLSIEFQFYLFVALCFPFFTGKWGQWVLALLSICTALIKLPGGTLIISFPIFALGILYYLYLAKGRSIKSIILPGIIIASCSIYGVGALQSAAALLALVLLLLPLKKSLIISFFSKISFSLYLTHDMVGANTAVWLGGLMPKLLLFRGIGFLTGLAVSILFAWLFYKVIEEPCLKLSQKLNY